MIRLLIEQNQFQDFLQFTKNWEKDLSSAMEALNIELPMLQLELVIMYLRLLHSFKRLLQMDMHMIMYKNIWKMEQLNNFIVIQPTYSKMRPEMNVDLLQERESQANKQQEKRSPNDFALWKASKPEEPKWPSPWVEVMASAIVGNPIDLHAGGIDLIFPHHDNSLAQAEAFFNCDQWINYFIYLGHLNIADRKMSKSLKNFLTIDEVLKKYTFRQIRLNFAIHQYDALIGLNYKLKIILHLTSSLQWLKYVPLEIKLNQLLEKGNLKQFKILSNRSNSNLRRIYQMELQIAQRIRIQDQIYNKASIWKQYDPKELKLDREQQ